MQLEPRSANAEMIAASGPERDETGELVLAADLARRLTDDALRVLADHGILAAPLKGVLLLARWPELRGRRDLADVDLLVTRETFTQCERLLSKLGFAATSRTNRGATLATDAWPLTLDLHHDLFSPHLFDMPTHRVLGRAERDDQLFDLPVLRLDDRDLFAHVIGHAVKSRFSPNAPHVVEDLSWLLAALDIDASRYASHLRDARMRRAAGYLLGTPPIATLATAPQILAELRLGPVDKAAIRTARVSPGAYWTPHVLNGSANRGLRSFAAQLGASMSRRARRLRVRPART